MSKTFRSCIIFFIATLWLVLIRLLSGVMDFSSNISGWLFSTLVQVVGLGIIPLTMYKFWVKGDIAKDFYIKAKINPLIYFLAIILGILMYYTNIGVSLINQMILRTLGFTFINSAGTIYSGIEVLILDIITVAVFPAIFEELTNRGLGMAILEPVKDDNLKILVLGILFGLAHQNILQTSYTFVGGLVFGFLAVKVGSILPGMIMHFVVNFLSIMIDFSSQTGGWLGAFSDRIYSFISSQFILAMLSWVLVGVAIFYLLKFIQSLVKKPSVDIIEENSEERAKLEFLFGFSPNITSSAKTTIKTKWYDYAFLYGAIALATATTIITLIWGLVR